MLKKFKRQDFRAKTGLLSSSRSGRSVQNRGKIGEMKAFLSGFLACLHGFLILIEIPLM